MRLRHKKNAEADILNCPLVINEKILNSNTGASKINISTIFNNDHPVHLELGMGKGKFITELSKQNFDINYIGIEKSATIILKAIDKLEQTNSLSTYSNLRFMCIDISNLNDIFDVSSIDKIYLNFSDPWPKIRHQNRRLTHRNFLLMYEKILKKDSYLEFKTDNKDLFDFSIEEIKNSNFKLLEWTYDLHHNDKMNMNNIMTEYEEKFSKIGNKICKLIAKI